MAISLFLKIFSGLHSEVKIFLKLACVFMAKSVEKQNFLEWVPIFGKNINRYGYGFQLRQHILNQSKSKYPPPRLCNEILKTQLST